MVLVAQVPQEAMGQQETTRPSVATSPHMVEVVVVAVPPDSRGEQAGVEEALLLSDRTLQGAQAAMAVPPVEELLALVVLLVKTVRHLAEEEAVRVEPHRRVDVLLGEAARAGLEVLVQVLLAVVGTRFTEVVQAEEEAVWTMLTLEHSRLEVLAAGSMLFPTVVAAQAALRARTTELLVLRVRRERASAERVEAVAEVRTQRPEELAVAAEFQEVRALAVEEAQAPEALEAPEQEEK